MAMYLLRVEIIEELIMVEKDVMHLVHAAILLQDNIKNCSLNNEFFGHDQ